MVRSIAVTRVNVKAVFLWAILTATFAGTTAKSNRAAHTQSCTCFRLSQRRLLQALWVKCSPRVTRRQCTCMAIMCLLRSQPLHSQKSSWVCISLKHRTLTEHNLSSPQPNLNICLGTRPSEHRDSVLSQLTCLKRASEVEIQ